LVQKKIIIFVIVILFTLYATLSSAAVGLTYDGTSYPADEPLVIEDGVTYVSARALIGMKSTTTADFDGTQAHFASSGLDLSAKIGSRSINANGNTIESIGTVRLIDNRVCVPVRSLATALGAEVEYDSESEHITLKTSGDYISNNTRYSEDELYWMSRIISAESCSEPYIGKLLVGNVVLNRKNSPNFPNTVYGVIFDRTNGVQFTPTANGAIYNTPCGECTQAAKAVLTGTVMSDIAMYFVNMNLVPVSWVSLNRPVLYKHGNHTFFM